MKYLAHEMVASYALDHQIASYAYLNIVRIATKREPQTSQFVYFNSYRNTFRDISLKYPITLLTGLIKDVYNTY